MLNSIVSESLQGLNHEWHYGSTAGWRNYSYRLALRLNCSGIAAKREFRTYYGNPSTRRWVVSFPASRWDAAVAIADKLEFPNSQGIKGKPLTI